VPVLPFTDDLLGTSVQHAPVTGTDKCEQAASALFLFSGAGSDNERMVNRVIGGGCSTCLPSAPPACMAGASGASTELSLLQDHGVVTSAVPVLQAARQPRRVDPDRRLQLAQGVGTNPTTSTLLNGPPQVLDCQEFLQAVLKGKYAGHRVKSVLEDISNAILSSRPAPRDRTAAQERARACLLPEVFAEEGPSQSQPSKQAQSCRSQTGGRRVWGGRAAAGT